MSQDLQLAMNTVRSPITQSGRVVFNAQKDPYAIWEREQPGNAAEFPKDCDECYSVLTHELAFHYTERKFQNEPGSGDRLPVITSFNHVPAEERKAYTFIGVVSSGARHDSTSQAANEEDCTVQIGGLCTVVNNSEGKIEAGTPVYVNTWDLKQGQQVRVLGTPARKLVATITDKPYQTANATTEYRANQYLGRAMCNAVKGAAVDILLGSQC